ncbi:DUF732 domain-containing protein [Mycobacterium szulgai]|uniref:DUF732 domain-containing protein n=1 Tax=Mycobacterium szulgai TaxID=1787 RepID=A0A1X2EEV6_MYCSZ|nr:DUF732 domain-containing protein [Mycobacterium szulgai]MCV7075975.1 DUF732 domain-containing protein [Mycobacterium szulgai]ORW99369.1 hypothetical protein AWC27_02680 [Mycobacterium szulgai]
MNLWRHQPLSVRLLATCAGVLTAAAALAAPAEANPVDDAFISALTNAGVNYGDPINAEALGQSVCPMLAESGGSFNSAAASVVARTQGMSQEMAETFTSIAISMYCPSVMADVAAGKLPGALQQIPGLSQIPGLPGS